MPSRRDFVRRCIACFVGMGLGGGTVFSVVGSARACTRKILLPRSTKLQELVDKNPGDLDTRNLEVTPLKDFGTMGLEDHHVDLTAWRLIVDGMVARPISLRYSDVLGLQPIERAVLLICPGIFANNGIWRGISVGALLKRSRMSEHVNFVTFRGPEGVYEKVMRVPVKEVLSDKVFLAYNVNGTRLPQKHGFPLRLVAEGYYGYDWVKYVYKVTASVIDTHNTGQSEEKSAMTGK